MRPICLPDLLIPMWPAKQTDSPVKSPTKCDHGSCVCRDLYKGKVNHTYARAVYAAELMGFVAVVSYALHILVKPWPFDPTVPDAICSHGYNIRVLIPCYTEETSMVLETARAAVQVGCHAPFCRHESVSMIKAAGVSWACLYPQHNLADLAGYKKQLLLWPWNQEHPVSPVDV